MTDTTWAVVFGGPSPEHEISILTGLQAGRILTNHGDDVVLLYWALNGAWFTVPNDAEAADFLDGAPKGSNPVEARLSEEPGFFEKRRLGAKRLEITAALLCLHGGLGEGGGAAALLSLMGIPATGSSPFAGSLGMDKLAFGALMLDGGVRSLPRVLLSPDQPIGFDGPFIVKPRFGGSSIGIEVVDSEDTALALLRNSSHLRAGAVVEPYRPELIDLNIGFRTHPALEFTQLERPLRTKESGAIYSYADKYLSGESGGAGLTHAPREFPAKVPAAVGDEARRLAAGVQRLTGLTGIVRVDLLLDEKSGELFVNEVNSIPGALSLYLWADQVEPATLLLDALREALDKPWNLPGGGFSSGAALRAAGGIAGKLVGLGGS